MSTHSETLRALVALVNERAEIEVERFFTPDFRLDQPGATPRYGHAGARQMIEGLLALGADVQVRILAMIEEGEHVAVRYLVTKSSPPPSAALLAMYRFVDGRIAEDWGLSAPQPWQDALRVCAS